MRATANCIGVYARARPLLLCLSHNKGHTEYIKQIVLLTVTAGTMYGSACGCMRFVKVCSAVVRRAFGCFALLLRMLYYTVRAQ